MTFENLGKKPFVVAEIGHNHQGNFDQALELIKEAKNCGVDAVKFQKRDNKALYTKAFYNSVYDHENSFGEVYGTHREFLEFDFEQYKDLKAFSDEIKIGFFATPFDKPSVDLLAKLEMPAYKIASADLTNTPLQKEIAKLNKPVFLSTGGGSLDDVKRAVDNISKINDKLIVMHCTASYPASIKDMNLSVISVFKKEFKKFGIGLSDHENGIDAGPIAYMLGARYFEKHFTLNRSNKGTDHSFSLEPQGLSRFVRNIRRIKDMMGSENKKLLKSEEKPLFKMKKSIVIKKDLKAGHLLKYEDLSFKSPGGGLEPYMYEKLVGKKLLKDHKTDELILFENIK